MLSFSDKIVDMTSLFGQIAQNYLRPMLDYLLRSFVKIGKVVLPNDFEQTDRQTHTHTPTHTHTHTQIHKHSHTHTHTHTQTNAHGIFSEMIIINSVIEMTECKK